MYAESGTRIASATGGASYRDEHRALAKGPAIVVGTPGRLLDHLERGSIDASQVQTVVLDEADRMLDLGFREDLERLFGCSSACRSNDPHIWCRRPFRAWCAHWRIGCSASPHTWKGRVSVRQTWTSST